MPFGQNLQGSPLWFSDANKEVAEKSRQLGVEPHVSYGQASSGKNELLKNEIAKLIESQKGNKFDIIPFSITGSSDPINFNPYDLRYIAEDEGFARRIYESATGYHNVSRDELRDLRQRARQQYESYSPEIRRLEPQVQQSEAAEVRRLPEPQQRNIAAAMPNVEAQQRNSYLENLNKIIEYKKKNINRDFHDKKMHELAIKSNKAGINKEELETEIRRLEKKLDTESTDLRKLSEERKSLKTEIRGLEPQVQQSKAAEVRRLPEPQQRNIAAAMPNVEAPQNIRKIDSRRLNKIINTQETDIRKLSEERSPLEAEIRRLEPQRQPATEVRQLPEPQQRNIAAAMPNPEPQQRNIAAAMPNVEAPRREILPAMSNPEDTIKRVSLQQEVNKLQEQLQGRIAPINRTSQRAIDMLHRSFDDNPMELSDNELQEAKKHSELEAVEPLVKSSIEDPSDEYMNKYINYYTKDIRKALEDESAEDFLKNIAPKINMSFAQMGAFHSGARAKALKDAANEHRVKLHRELAHLTGSSIDKGMEHHELKKRREQSAAHILGHTTKSEKEASQRQSELLRQNAVTKQAINHANAATLGQIGEAEHKQKQHEIDAKRQEFERHRLFPEEQLAKEAAILNGLPQPNSLGTNWDLGNSPSPSNPFTTMAATVAALASGPGFGQKIQSAKKGGSIRKKYADGGSIRSDEIGNEIRKIINEQSQNNKLHLSEASHHDPMQSWLRHVGKEMLANPHEDPLLSLGRGSYASMDHGDMMRERAANLYNKIQDTKLNQYKVLAEYENMKDRTALQREKLLENSNYHKQKINLHKQKINLHKKTSQEKKMEDKALENIMENHEMKNDLTLMKDAIDKSTLGTGPWLGLGKSFLGIDNDIDVLGNHIVTKANKLYGRGSGSNLQLKTIQGGKPGQNLSKKANETIIKKYGQESNRRINKNISFLLKSGWSPEEISAATGMEMPNNSLKEPQINNEEELTKINIVNMTDPEGNPLEVPKDQVKQALDLGAVLVQ